MSNQNNKINNVNITRPAKQVGRYAFTAASKAAKTIARAKKGAATSKITAQFLQALFKTLGTLLGTALGIILATVMVVLIVLMNFSKSTLFSKAEDINTITNNTDSVIREAYDLRKNDAIANAVGYLDANYLCGLTSDNYNPENSTFSSKVNSVNCNVKLEFTPEYTSAINNINAYASAVNSTLSLYDYEEEAVSADSTSGFSDELEINDYFSQTNNERESTLNNLAEKIQNSGNEYETQLNDKYVQTLRNRKNSIFLLEPIDSWTKNISYRPDVIVGYEQKTVIDSVYCLKMTTNSAILSSAVIIPGASCPSGYRMTGVASQHSEDDHSKPIKETFVEGNISASIKYDMTFYKKNELNILTNWIINSGKYGENLEYGGVYSELQDNIYTYYNNYFRTYHLDTTDSTGATLMGTDPIFFETGSPGWEGDFKDSDYVYFYDYKNKAKNNGTNIIWNHIHGEVGGTKTQCVTFVIGWIYDAYGTNKGTVGLGNGQNVVHTLVERDGWKLLDTPAPGAIFSTGPRADNPYGHTGIILSVHGDEVVILEGNMDHNGGIACRTFSLQNLLSEGYAGSKLMKFAVPN